MDDSSFSWERFKKKSSFTKSRNRIQAELEREKHEDLFVFGYSCKLYRDDEKFRWINSCKHLIPWMGQDNLLVDRYDARGYLNDLAEFDPKNIKCSNAMNIKEIDFENSLNEERFADLKFDDAADKDENDNGNHGQYSQVNYQYDRVQENKTENDNDNSAKYDTFKVPNGLNIPDSIILPESNKLHSIIEKTALFVAQQGSQMEILLKTKQASNSSFNFLSIDSDLNPYYKFILAEIKAGKYASKKDVESDSDSNDDDNYLHPSLLSSQKVSNKEKVNIANLFMSKQENDSYSQLVKHFKDKFADEIEHDSNSCDKSTDSSNNSSSNSVSSLIPQPSQDVEIIIIKLAQHVAKNGEDFENSIKALNDKKFDFLNPGHIYHPYYVKQKINYLSEVKQKQTKNSDSTKLIAFSITSKERPKKIRSVNTALIENGLDDIKSSSGSSTSKKETNLLSKEKQLQEERKKKAFEFLKLLRKENRLENFETAVYGPNLPKSKDNVQLSPTIERITSPTHSSTFDDQGTLLCEIKKGNQTNNQANLPFTSNDNLIKDRSISPVLKCKSKSSQSSPPRRYRLSRDDESPYKKSTNYYKRGKSSRNHRHRSRSNERFDRKISRNSKHSSRHDHRRSSSYSRSSRSRSCSPRIRHKDKSKRHGSRSHRLRSRSRSRS